MTNTIRATGIAALLLMLCFTSARGQESVFSTEDYEFAQRYTLLRINQERTRAGVSRVDLDPLASHAAKLHAEDMLDGEYLSHWDRQGLMPSRRYNLLGGYDSVGENVYYQHGPTMSLEDQLNLMMDTLMDSAGHRKTILDPSYTYVGLGFALNSSGTEFYASQEFIVRIGGEFSCPLTARVGDTVEFSGRFDQNRYDLEHVVASYTDPPQPRERSWLMRTGSYQIGGKPFAGYSPDRNLRFQGMETYYSITVDPQSGRFRCQAVLNYKNRPGMYYLTLWLREKASGQSVMAATATVDTGE